MADHDMTGIRKGYTVRAEDGDLGRVSEVVLASDGKNISHIVTELSYTGEKLLIPAELIRQTSQRDVTLATTRDWILSQKHELRFDETEFQPVSRNEGDMLMQGQEVAGQESSERDREAASSEPTRSVLTIGQSQPRKRQDTGYQALLMSPDAAPSSHQQPTEAPSEHTQPIGQVDRGSREAREEPQQESPHEQQAQTGERPREESPAASFETRAPEPQAEPETKAQADVQAEAQARAEAEEGAETAPEPGEELIYRAEPQPVSEPREVESTEAAPQPAIVQPEADRRQTRPEEPLFRERARTEQAPTFDRSQPPFQPGVRLQEDEEIAYRGTTKIDRQVVRKIAGFAAQDVEGVYTGRRRQINKDDVTKGISVEVGKTEAAMDMTVVTEYDKHIPTVCEQLRQSVRERVERLTGLRVTEINITIDDVLLDGRDQGDEHRQVL